MTSLNTTEINRIFTLEEDQIEVEINTCITIDADLKNQNRTRLNESTEIKQRLNLAMQNGNDTTGPTQELNENDKELKDLQKEIELNNTRQLLLKSHRAKKIAAKADSDQTIRESGLEVKDVYSKQDMIKILAAGKGRDSKDEIADMMRNVFSRKDPPDISLDDRATSRKTLGRLPEFDIKSDFELFLRKLNTYVKLNNITDDRQMKLLLDSCISDGAKLRSGQIDSTNEPYASQSFKAYTNTLRERFFPRARSMLFQDSYDQLKQQATQNIQDFLSIRFTAFRRGYPDFPFEFFVRSTLDKVYSPDLKVEILRTLGPLESSKETDADRQQSLFSSFLQISNQALHFCRRVSSQTPDQMNRQGLAVEAVEGDTPAVLSSTSTSTAISTIRTVAECSDSIHQADAFYPDYEEDQWYETQDHIWQSSDFFDEEQSEEGLSTQQQEYCFALESPAETAVWEREPTADEVAQLQQSPTQKACFQCGSSGHLVKGCPTRLRIIQQRTAHLQSPPGAGGGGGGGGGSRFPRNPRSWRGQLRGSPRGRGFRPRSWQATSRGGGGGGGRRGPSTFRGTGSPAVASHSSPYNPTQSPAVMGPHPGQQFFRS